VPLRLGDVAEAAATVKWDEPLLKALEVMVGRGGEGPYRVVVLAPHNVIRGIITGRVMLEVLAGWRASALRLKVNLRGLLEEPVHVFANEVYNALPHWLGLAPAIGYMLENRLGYVLVVGEHIRLIGIVEEKTLLPYLVGRKYGTAVKEVMKRNLSIVSPEEPLRNALAKMVTHMRRRLPVVQGREVKGIVTTTDILSAIINNIDNLNEALNLSVREVMESNVTHIAPDDDLGVAIEKLVEEDVSSVLVLRNGHVEGIITRLDALLAVARLLGVRRVASIIEASPVKSVRVLKLPSSSGKMLKNNKAH